MLSEAAAATATEAVFTLLAEHGDGDYVGERVSQLQHAQQAAEGARRDGADEQVILAALLHDIGHLVGLSEGANRMITDDVTLGVADHERVGADFLRKLGFPERITFLVENHVLAKRYLTFKDEGYHDHLSAASRATLVHQGGPMTTGEAEEFEHSAEFATILHMRRWDEAAKCEQVAATPLEPYRRLCMRVLTGTATE